jgi:hypothetical protein
VIGVGSLILTAYLASGGAPVAPTVSAVSTLGGAVGDIAGGYSATVTGTNFVVGATTFTFGGTSATGVTVASSTSATMTVPAHATGAVSVVATTTGGSSAANTLFRYFSPAELVISGWWRAPYAGSPFTPTASAGTSGANGNLITSGAAPTVGTSVNGYAPASCNGTTQSFVPGTAPGTDLWTAAAGTSIVLAKAASGIAATANFYDEPCLATDNSGNLGMSFTTSGVRAGVYIAGSKQTAFIAQATGAWFMAAGRWDSTNVNLRVNSTDATPVAAAGVVGVGSGAGFLRNYISAQWFEGDALEIITARTALTAANLSDIRSYMATRYNQAL